MKLPLCSPWLPSSAALLLVLALALGTTGCGNLAGGGPTTEAGCADDARAEAYEVGREIEGDGGLVLFRMGAISPAPADVGYNQWLVSLVDSAALTPLEGCTLTATPWMPDHEHGSNEPTATEEGEPGDYVFGDLSFVMAGYWEVTLLADCPALDATDLASLGICVEG